MRGTSGKLGLEGKTRTEYAAELFCSSSELRTQIWSLDRKLGLSGRSVRVEDGVLPGFQNTKPVVFGGAGWLAGGEGGRVSTE